MRIFKYMGLTVAVVLGFLLVLFSLGTITATNLTPHPVGWAINATSADFTGCEELVAAPATGDHYIKQIAINCPNDITVTIGSGESSSAVVTPIIGPVTFGAEGNFMSWTFITPLRVPDSNSINIDASSSTAIQVFIAGKTK